MPTGVATFAVTTDAAGAGTANSTRPLRGEALIVRIPNAGTALTGTGSTCDFRITRAYDGGTIIDLTNVSAPLQYQPRDPVHSLTGGTSAYSLGVGPVYTDSVPMWGTVTCTVASGAPSASGTVYLIYRL